jgi:peptidoglycan/xylan/chitin deacetylase (PgdA/CDA1 family)
MKLMHPAKILSLILVIILQSMVCRSQTAPGQTTITEWPYGKTSAVSLTFDDGSINQFRQALPILNRLKLPGTFFVITGGIPGSKYQGKFIGRPVKTIISETATIPTNKDNFFERCSAAGFLGFIGTLEYHTRAGSLYDEGKAEQAYKLMDELYLKVRDGAFKPGYQPSNEVLQEAGLTWPDLRRYAAQGHEIASHSITHPAMPALDEVNLLYELEKSKQEILNQLGPKYTFSAECPYGFENPRVISYAYKIYPALRNRMPEPFLKEIDRASRQTPGSTDKDYIQWQRGGTTKTPLPMMKLWVDTVLNKNNTWLCLTFHGVDGLGYEAISHQVLDAYFSYIKAHENQLWIATFGDVTKYMREREHARISQSKKDEKITISVSNPLDKSMYNVPLTLKTYTSRAWKAIKVVQGKQVQRVVPMKDDKGSYLLYQVNPNGPVVQLSGI